MAPWNPTRQKQQTQRRHERANRIRAIKTDRGCARCGYDEHGAALDFHHRDESEKLFSIGSYNAASWQRTLDEIAKCDVLCANCHRIETYERQPHR